MKNNSENFEIGKEKVDKWTALPEDYEPDDLVDLPLNIRARGCDEKVMKLREEALNMFQVMLESAEKDGITIRCISAFRPYSYQKMLYDKACTKEGKDQTSTAKPGYSEHQLGTVVDITSPEIDEGLSEKFSETKAYQWIEKNAYQFGFYISYTKENHKEKGYIWEPWHLRYWGKEKPKE